MNPAKRILLYGVIGLQATAAHSKEPKANAWGYARAGPVEVRARPSSKGRVLARLGRGSVAELYGTETRAGSQWCHVHGVNLKDLTSVVGWADCAGMETLPLDRLPDDDTLLTEVGGPFLEDTARPHILIARFVVGAGGAPTLVCFFASPFLAQARLQAFQPVEGQYRAGAFLEFPFSEQAPGITALEVRDLLSDGNDCLITHEPVNFGRGETGVNLVIRRIERGRPAGAGLPAPPTPNPGQAGGLRRAGVAGKFEKLWEAPLELARLASYPPHLEVLQPPERNIGAPGTVTKGEVTFRPQSGVTVPVWAGTVEFHVLGREKPLQTIRFEKTCPWKGAQFTPLR